MKQLQIIYRPVDSLIPYARNAKVHSDAHVAQIAASIREFGWTVPILCDGDNGVIAGHGRLLAARLLRMAEVPTIELSGLTDTQRRAYIIADNRLGDPINSPWDEEMLQLELADLSEAGLDLNLVGFTEAQLAELGGDWNSDIEKIDRDKENLDGIKAKIRVLLDPKDKNAVLEAIRQFCAEHAITAEIE